MSPMVCPKCGSDQTQHQSDDENQLSTVAIVVVTAILSCVSILTLVCGGLSGTSLLLAFTPVILAVIFAWYVHIPQGKSTIQRIVAALTRIKEWNEERIEKKRRIEEEKHRRALAMQRLREMKRRRRQEEIEKAMRPVRVRWKSRSGVDANKTLTFGLGREYVYCYSFNSILENARMKQQPRCNIKVGMASNHPIERIQQQVSASKTAMSEAAVVLLVFQTSDCRQLERWLHQRLERVTEALGREWFLANPEELIGLFRTYVQEHFVPSPAAIQLQDDDFV